MARQLTHKQEMFCQGIASGLTQYDAYIQAYNADNMSDQGIYNESSKLMKRDDITERIQAIRKPVENYCQNAIISEIEESKRFLWDVVRDDTEKTENRIRAVDILNKMNQAYQSADTGDDTTDSIDSLDTDKLIQLVNTA